MDKDLLYRFFEGRASVEEMRLVKELSEAFEENSKLLRRERKLFNAIILSGRFESSDGQTTLRKKRNHFVREFLKIASVVAITVGITAALFSIGEDKEDMNVAMQTITVPAGQRVNLDLPDGSNVWLNAGTTMKYPVLFMKGKREVMLDGEAYFEVTRDEKYPFVVSVKNFDVRVLGTSFNVMTYRGRTITTLVEGKVCLTYKDESVLMVPDRQAEVIAETGKILMREVDARNFTLWKDGVFYFENAALETIAERLSQWYDVNIVFNDEALKKLRYSVEMKRYNNIQDLLTKIEKTQKVKFLIQGKSIYIHKWLETYDLLE